MIGHDYRQEARELIQLLGERWGYSSADLRYAMAHLPEREQGFRVSTESDYLIDLGECLDAIGPGFKISVYKPAGHETLERAETA